MPLDPKLQEIVKVFAVEAEQRAGAIRTHVEALRASAADERAWTGLVRELHTLKGTAAIFGLDDLARAAARMHQIVRARTPQTLEREVGDLVVRASAALAAQVRTIADGAEAPFPSTILKELDEVQTAV